MTPEEAEQLQAQNATQEQTIKNLWVLHTAMQKRVDHGQAYIKKLEAHIAKLEAQLTDEAIAERVFG